LTGVKILHLTTYLQGGAGKVILDLAKTAKNKGTSVTVGFTKEPVKGYCNYSKYIKSLKEAQINKIELPTTFDRNPLKIEDTANIIVDKLQANPPDLIHCHAANPSRIALKLRLLTNLQIPVIQTMHGWGIYKTLDQEIEDIETLNKIDQVISISKSSDTLLKSKGLKNKRSSITYNGIEDYKSQTGNTTDNDLQELIRLKKQGFFIAGIVGTLDVRKNQRTVLEAIKTLPKTLKIKFFFIGEGEIGEMINFANSLNITEKVNFIGYKKNGREFINHFDLLISSSKSEGGPPIVLMEAFASNTLALASNTPEHNEAISEGLTGFLYETNEIFDLKEKIIQIYEMRNTNNIRLNAYNFFKDKFSFNRFILEYESIYKELTVKKLS
jgi:glycosyltransferase involved in cell wall biosynthesis